MWSRSIQPNVRLSPEKHDKKNTQNPNPVHRSLNLYGWGPRWEAAMLCLMFISVLIVVRKLAHVIIRSDKSTQRSNKIINHEKKYPLQLFWKTLLQTWDVLHLKCIFFSSKHCVIYIHWFFLIFKTRNWIFPQKILPIQSFTVLVERPLTCVRDPPDHMFYMSLSAYQLLYTQTTVNINIAPCCRSIDELYFFFN